MVLHHHKIRWYYTGDFQATNIKPNHLCPFCSIPSFPFRPLISSRLTIVGVKNRETRRQVIEECWYQRNIHCLQPQERKSFKGCDNFPPFFATSLSSSSPIVHLTCLWTLHRWFCGRISSLWILQPVVGFTFSFLRLFSVLSPSFLSQDPITFPAEEKVFTSNLPSDFRTELPFTGTFPQWNLFSNKSR